MAYGWFGSVEAMSILAFNVQFGTQLIKASFF
jgi:hypothetical protein